MRRSASATGGSSFGCTVTSRFSATKTSSSRKRTSQSTSSPGLRMRKRCCGYSSTFGRWCWLRVSSMASGWKWRRSRIIAASPSSGPVTSTQTKVPAASTVFSFEACAASRPRLPAVNRRSMLRSSARFAARQLPSRALWRGAAGGPVVTLPPSPSPAAAPRRRRFDPVVAAVFALGLLLSLLLALRSQVGGDQLNLLARGWPLLARGEWLPYGTPSSSGGAVPGGVTALLVAAPMLLWRHHRAAVLGLLLTQVLAFALLDRWLREALPRRERRLFSVVYWLSPWRLLLSGFLWNPGYLLLLGAVHAWSAWRQRERAAFWPSFALALALGLGFQIHPSVTLLGAATMLLLLAGHTRLHWRGAAAGTAVAVATLVPWMIAVAREPKLLPVSEGFPFRGLVLVFPLVRGVLYWLRHGSLELPRAEARFDFAPELGDGWARPAEIFANGLVVWVGVATILVPLVANLWLWRRLRRRGLADMLGVGQGRRAWVVGYVRVCFVAALLTYAAAPTTVMWWQGVALLHAVLLPLVLWAGTIARRRRRRRAVRVGAWSWGTCAVLIAVLIAVGGRRDRCGGEDPIVLPLRRRRPMLAGL